MLETFDQPSRPLVDQRQAAFARLVGRVLEALNHAVETRKEQGQSASQIAERIGCHKSALSRILSGNSRNLTLRTISDIFWATDFEPRDFSAEPLEIISHNLNSFHESSLKSEEDHGFRRYYINADFDSAGISNKFVLTYFSPQGQGVIAE